MKKTKFIQIVALLLAVLTISSIFTVTAAADDGNSSSDVTYDWGQISDILNATSYETYLSRFTDVQKGSSPITVDVIDDFVKEKSDAYGAKDMSAVTLSQFAQASNPAQGSYLSKLAMLEGADNAIYLPDTGMATWKVEVPAKGLYGVRIIYAQVTDSTSSIERMLYLNDEIPFSEARALSLHKSWKYDYESANNADGKNTPYFVADINGNDLRAPLQLADPEWMTYECVDSNGYTIHPLQFCFEAGTNYLGLSASREAMAIKAIILYPVESLKTYDQYISQYKDAPLAPSDAVIKFEAELPTYVSDSSVYAANDRTSAITTSNVLNKETLVVENKINSPSAQLLNTIGSNSYDTVGQYAAYTFTVEKTGRYNIVMRYKQTKLEGMFISRVLKIKGGAFGDTPVVPFEEAYYTRFNYAKDWQAQPLGNGEKTFEFYLEEGQTYTIYLEVGLGSLCDIIGTVEETLEEINSSYLEILKLTGPNPDQYRSYNFTKIMPSTIRSLLECSKTLYGVSEQIKEICGTTGSHIVILDNVARLLDTMGKNPEDEIAANLNNLKSYIGTLGTWINDSKTQSVTVDYIQLQSPEAKLPKADAGFFRAIWFEISAFAKSFTTDYNSMGVTVEGEDVEAIDVWLAYGRDQSQIWRNLVNDNFTPETGIAVNLKLVTAGTLLPSVLAGSGPDIYIGLAAGDTINYAIRGAIASLNEFEDVGNYLDGNYFTEAALVPISLYGELYGLPETMAFNMMFIREDVLASMQLNVPETWDDLLATNTTLVANNMEIGIAYADVINKMIYQSGSSIWKYEEEGGIYAGSQIAYGDDLQLEIFTRVTRYFTDYSFPLTFNASNRFRTGELPIFIADYVASYNQLVVFATEIKNVWSFYRVPGTLREDGTVDHSTTAVVTATVMLHGVENKEAAWKFMKWQTSADMQAEYGNEMVALIGPSAKYATANIQAIKNLSWTTKEYERIQTQLYDVAAVANYPGNYILARYIEFAFMDAYNNGTDPAYAMKSYINTINKEINRKREEFNLPVIEIGSDLSSTLAK